VIAVAHPDIEHVRQAHEELAPIVHIDGRRAVLPGTASLETAAEHLGGELQAVADTEHGYAEVENAFLDAGMAFFEDRCRASGQDDGLGAQAVQVSGRGIVGENLAVDPALADAPGDELGVLRTEVKHGYEFTHE